MLRGDRIEAVLVGGLERATTGDCPPRLAEALRYAVFPAGGRVRPRLALSVAYACGDRHPEVVDAAAAAVELVHCASLVHDDMPCFDAAATRRGRPTVPRRYGEATALLVGDALIVQGFAELARIGSLAPELLGPMLQTLSSAAGSAHGIVGGQAWEQEARVEFERYHRAKTAALFEAAAVLGAMAGGGNPDAWGVVGIRIGDAYQLADDLADAHGHAVDLGRPVGQDESHHRPSAVSTHGRHDAKERLAEKIQEATSAIPPCPQRARLTGWLAEMGNRLYRPAPGLESLPRQETRR